MFKYYVKNFKCLTMQSFLMILFQVIASEKQRTEKGLPTL